MTENNRVPNWLYQLVITIAALNVPMAGLMFLRGSTTIGIANVATAAVLAVLVVVGHELEERVHRERPGEENPT